MINYEKLWFQLKKHIIEKDIPDLIKVMARLELGEYEAENPTPMLPGVAPREAPPPSTTFVPVPQVRDKYGVSAPIVTMYAVRPVDFDPFTGAPVGWQQSVSSTIKITEDK